MLLHIKWRCSLIIIPCIFSKVKPRAEHSVMFVFRDPSHLRERLKVVIAGIMMKFSQVGIFFLLTPNQCVCCMHFFDLSHRTPWHSKGNYHQTNYKKNLTKSKETCQFQTMTKELSTVCSADKIKLFFTFLIVWEQKLLNQLKLLPVPVGHFLCVKDAWCHRDSSSLVWKLLSFGRFKYLCWRRPVWK